MARIDGIDEIRRIVVPPSGFLPGGSPDLRDLSGAVPAFQESGAVLDGAPRIDLVRTGAGMRVRVDLNGNRTVDVAILLHRLAGLVTDDFLP